MILIFNRGFAISIPVSVTNPGSTNFRDILSNLGNRSSNTFSGVNQSNANTPTNTTSNTTTTTNNENQQGIIIEEVDSDDEDEQVNENPATAEATATGGNVNDVNGTENLNNVETTTTTENNEDTNHDNATASVENNNVDDNAEANTTESNNNANANGASSSNTNNGNGFNFFNNMNFLNDPGIEVTVQTIDLPIPQDLERDHPYPHVPSKSPEFKPFKVPDNYASYNNPEGKELQTCSICLEEMDQKKHALTRLVCGHEFHMSCVGSWFNSIGKVFFYI